MAYVDGVGYLFESVGGYSTPENIYSAKAGFIEYDEVVGLGRFDLEAPGTMGWLAGVLGAIGEADNKIGGYRVTRLMDPVDVGEDVFPVEDVYEWLDAGRVAIDGVVYSYTNKGPGRLSGITHLFHGDVVRGARKLHSRDAAVLDLGNPYNAVQKLRRSFLVDYAEEEDLNTIGRNLGVFRYPYLPLDDTYREIVKALAYNPRGTLYGIRLALDAMVGEGNYELIEDLIRHPCTVYIKLASGLLVEAKNIGHAYLQSVESPVVDGSSQLAMTDFPCSRGHQESVVWRDLKFLHPFSGSVRPSDVLTEDFDGDVGTPLWDFVGTDESTQVTPGTDYVTITNASTSNPAYYRAYTRSDFTGDEQGWKVSMLFKIPTGFCHNTSYLQWGMKVHDGKKTVACGVGYNLLTHSVRLVDGTTGIGNSANILEDTWYEVTLEKRISKRGAFESAASEAHEIVLSLNGKEISRYPYWDFSDVAVDSYVAFGSLTHVVLTNTAKGYIKHVGVTVEARQDLADGLFDGRVGNVDANTLDNAPADTFHAEDIGKRVITRYSTVTNAYGGNNNGIWKILARTSATQVTLVGEDHTDAFVDTGNPKQISADSPVFQFPDDLGRKIVITNSINGNNGTYTIAKLFQDGTGKDLAADFDTPVREKASVCEVAESVAFVTEGGLTFHLEPNFTLEDMAFTLSDASDVVSVGGLPKLQIRGNFSAGSAVNKSTYLSYSRVLTGQILLDSNPVLSVISEVPLRYSHYPFYLTDPLGYVRSYLDDLTAAGVIAEYMTE